MTRLEQWREWVEEIKTKLLSSITPEQEEKWEQEYDIQFIHYGAPTCKSGECKVGKPHWHFVD